MRKTPIIVTVFLFVALLGLWLGKKAQPVLQARTQQQTSDAKDLKGKIRLALDDWVGYYPLDSGRMRKFMRSEGYALEVTNDGGDYPTRMRQLRDGKLDFAVVTVDSYILNAAAVDFPATIIAILDESRGGDAMVAYKSAFPNLDAFKSGKNLIVAYTPGSPSHHLLKSMATHFNAPALKNLDKSQRVETKDSQEALKLFAEGKVPVAILWEPNVSKALSLPGAVKILGTESTSRLIVDILVVSRDFAAKNPEQVDLFLRTYFRVLKYYNDNPEDLRKDLAAQLKTDRDSVEKMLSGVAWVNLSDNCQEWFGVNGPGQISEQGLVDTVGSTVSILIESGDFKEDPLPDKDPYRIVNSSFIQSIYATGLRNGFATIGGTAVAAAAVGIDRPFKALTEGQWKALRSVGSIRIEPISFRTGLSSLEVPEKEKLDAMVNRLKHYPTFRILVGGHTSAQGDSEANLALSQERADAVSRYLSVSYNVDQNRIRSVGYGGSKPLPKESNESDRAYNFRLPRVEISLLAESY
jgi:outer membrane protein OmpA-like peptidoglycan-associated protein/ABC-type nitrate/sulfonate/bicarbonate transport system substrate-binding protein